MGGSRPVATVELNLPVASCLGTSQYVRSAATKEPCGGGGGAALPIGPRLAPCRPATKTGSTRPTVDCLRVVGGGAMHGVEAQQPSPPACFFRTCLGGCVPVVGRNSARVLLAECPCYDPYVADSCISVTGLGFGAARTRRHGETEAPTPSLRAARVTVTSFNPSILRPIVYSSLTSPVLHALLVEVELVPAAAGRSHLRQHGQAG
jgi:hypothetical protein